MYNITGPALRMIIIIFTHLQLAARAEIKAIDAGAQMCAVALQAVDGEHASALLTRPFYLAGQMSYVATRLNCNNTEEGRRTDE